MKYFMIAALTLTLSGCGDSRTTAVVIDIQEWTCSKSELTEVNTMIMVGKVPIPKLENKYVCVQWSRMGK